MAGPLFSCCVLVVQSIVIPGPMSCSSSAAGSQGCRRAAVACRKGWTRYRRMDQEPTGPFIGHQGHLQAHLHRSTAYRQPEGANICVPSLVPALRLQARNPPRRQGHPSPAERVLVCATVIKRLIRRNWHSWMACVN